MAEQTIDVLMRVVGSKDELPADSLTKFTTSIGSDTLRDGFRPGYFCDLREFSFSAGLEGSMSKHAKEKLKEEKKAQAKATNSGGERKWTESFELKQENLRQAQRTKADKRLHVETVDMQPVDYARIVDSSSTLLFKALTECETLNEISIVKRKAAGTANSGECYLRLDFEKVLLTRLEWKDQQHLMVETGTFIYRKVTIRYRPQLASGALGAIVQSSWTMRQAPTD